MLDHGDRLSREGDLGGELGLVEPPERAGRAQALSDDVHTPMIINDYS